MADVTSLTSAREKKAWPLTAFPREFYDALAEQSAAVAQSLAVMAKAQGQSDGTFMPGFVCGNAIGIAETARAFQMDDAAFEQVVKDIATLARLRWREGAGKAAGK